MCGVVGIYSYDRDVPAVDRKELRAIRDHMAARGPDGAGEWYSADGRVALGHRRLSIIDLSDRGLQPMPSADGRFVVTFNGEIYNYKALRRELQAKGYLFRSESDTEVLLYLYAEKGEKMVHDLRGMFAFAIWDARRQNLFLARDPYGIKPLYFSDSGGCFRFASQVKALQAGGAISREPDPAGMAGFLLLGSVPEPFTILRGVKALPAGTWLMANRRGIGKPQRYFSIAASWREAGEKRVGNFDDEAAARVGEALRDSVRHHQVSDVPVGAFLSAGIDSGALVGLMGESGAAPRTVTVAFDEFRGLPEDEAPQAAHVAAHYGVDHSVYRVTEDEFCEDWTRILDAMDQPTIDGVNTWFAAKAARAQGLKVAVSGLGGDELFGGYPSFTDIPRWVRWFALPSRIPGLGRAVKNIGARLIANRESPITGLNPKAWGLLVYADTYPGAWLLRRGLFMPWELPGLMGAERARAGLERLRPLTMVGDAMRPDPEYAFGRVAAMEASLYMRNQLLRDADWAGMAHSLEIRMPLVDSALLSLVAPLLARNKAAKQVLAAAPENKLPASIRVRDKTGFAVPYQQWTERIEDLGAWRCKPALSRPGCHWSRRFAYSVAAFAASDSLRSSIVPDAE